MKKTSLDDFCPGGNLHPQLATSYHPHKEKSHTVSCNLPFLISDSLFL